VNCQKNQSVVSTEDCARNSIGSCAEFRTAASALSVPGLCYTVDILRKSQQRVLVSESFAFWALALFVLHLLILFRILFRI
jgi:hypothetical protein